MFSYIDQLNDLIGKAIAACDAEEIGKAAVYASLASSVASLVPRGADMRAMPAWAARRTMTTGVEDESGEANVPSRIDQPAGANGAGQQNRNSD